MLLTQIKYLDMFAGIGGFRSGLSKFGDFFMPIGFCEIDPYARRAYEAIYDTDWRMKNRNTKWNTYGFEVPTYSGDAGTMTFLTANGSPFRVSACHNGEGMTQC